AIEAAAKSGLTEPGLSETGTARTAAETTAVESASEQITENVIHVHIAAIAGVEMELPVTVSGILSVSISSGAAALAAGGMTKLVVYYLLFFICQDIVGFRDLLESLFRPGIVGICIRVIFLCQLPVCPLNLSGACIPAHSKNIIIISLCCHIHHLPYTNKT